MGKKRGWFFVVKKVLSPESKKVQKTPKSKNKWFGKSNDLGPPVSLPEETEVITPPPPTEDVKLAEAENEQSKHAYSVALATVMAAAAAVAAAQAAAEVVRLSSVPPLSPGKSAEEIAAIKIQSGFRGYLARRALRALRRSARLKSLIQGQSIKRQATTTLRCMQTLARVQSQIRARRLRMSEENQVLQQQLQQKRQKELDEKLRASIGEDWNDSTQSKEQTEAKEQNKQEAAMRRERALAYAFSHQQSWKNSSKSVNQTFMDPNINPHWGWSWLERWMAARPWEIRSTTDHNNDRSSVKTMGAYEISKTYSRKDLNNNNYKPSLKPSKSSRLPSRRQSPSTPPSKPPSISSVSSKIRLQPSPKGRSRRGADEDSRRHSSLAGSAEVPSYLASTRSTKASSFRLLSPLGLEKNGTIERGLAGSANKRLSFPASAAKNRKHCGPSMVDITRPVKDIKMQKEKKRN